MKQQPQAAGVSSLVLFASFAGPPILNGPDNTLDAFTPNFKACEVLFIIQEDSKMGAKSNFFSGKRQQVLYCHGPWHCTAGMIFFEPKLESDYTF